MRVTHLVGEDIGNLAGHRVVGPDEFDAVRRVVEFAGPGAVDGDAVGDAVVRLEGVEGGGVGRVETDEQGVAVDGQGCAGRETEIHGVAQAPDDGCIRRMVKRDRRAADVVKFNELVLGVVPNAIGIRHVGRVVVDFGDDDGADARRRIGGAERAGDLGHEPIPAVAGEVSAEGDAVELRSEIESAAVGKRERNQVYKIAARQFL